MKYCCHATTNMFKPVTCHKIEVIKAWRVNGTIKNDYPTSRTFNSQSKVNKEKNELVAQLNFEIFEFPNNNIDWLGNWCTSTPFSSTWHFQLPTSASEWITHKLTNIIHMRLISPEFTVFDDVYSYSFANSQSIAILHILKYSQLVLASSCYLSNVLETSFCH